MPENRDHEPAPLDPTGSDPDIPEVVVDTPAGTLRGSDGLIQFLDGDAEMVARSKSTRRFKVNEDPWAVVKVRPPTIVVEAGELKAALAERKNSDSEVRMANPPPAPSFPATPMSEPSSATPASTQATARYEAVPAPAVSPSPPSAPPPPPPFVASAPPLARRAAPEDPGAGKADALPEWQGWLTLALVFSMPLVAFGQPSALLSGWVEGLPNFTWFDVGVWALALATAAAAAVRGVFGTWLARWAGCVWPTFPLLIAAGASLLAWEPGDRDAWKQAGIESFKWVEFFLVAPWVLLPALRSERWRGRTLGVLALAMAYVLGDLLFRFPLVDFHAGRVHPARAGGWLESRHLYGLYAGVVACLMSGWWATGRGTGFRWSVGGSALLLVPALLLTPVLSGWLLAGALLGLAATWSGVRRGGAFLLLPLMAWLFWIGPVVLTAKSAGEAVSGIFAKETPAAAARQRELLAESLQTWYEGDAESGHRALPSSRFMRWTAELNMASVRPWLGSGLGQVQTKVGGYYGTLPRARGNTADDHQFERRSNEPSTFSWYHQTLAETGLFGLAGVLLLVGELFGRALRLGRSQRMLAAGLTGAVLVLAFGALWTQPLVRGAGALLGFLLALSGLAGMAEENNAEDR